QLLGNVYAADLPEVRHPELPASQREDPERLPVSRAESGREFREPAVYRLLREPIVRQVGNQLVPVPERAALEQARWRPGPELRYDLRQQPGWIGAQVRRDRAGAGGGEWSVWFALHPDGAGRHR